MYSLDLETAPTKPTTNPYALEPYRVLTKQSKITSCAIYSKAYGAQQFHERQSDFHGQIKAALESMAGEEVYCHNAIFDVSYLIATYGYDAVKNIRWRDTAILNKWLINSQRAEEVRIKYSLKECVKRYIKDHPDVTEYLDLKNETVTAGENYEYWLKRGRQDAEFTYKLAEFLESKLTPDTRRGYVVVCATILPISKGYVQGINIDVSELIKYNKATKERMKDIIDKLSIEPSVITSTKQLGNLLFNQWNFQPVAFTPKGAPSLNAESMLRLLQSSSDPRLKLIMEYKKGATMLSKYVDGFARSLKYIDSHKIHSQPRLLSTVTGRMTYSSTFFKKPEYQTSIALHQLPRKDKGIKRCMIPPEGYKVLYMDFSAQEGRVMAIVAGEETMINSYNKGIDLHSDLTEEIFGVPYDVICKANQDGKPLEIVEQRQAGKLTNLSSFYRIGAKALASKFFSTYEYEISISTALSYIQSFKRKYPGVVKYWYNAIGFAKANGYAEAFGGWRFRITDLGWKGESSAINHPIQGGGSMITYAAISVICRTFPELILVAQVHDSLTYYIPEERHIEKGLEILKYMNKYDYGKLLGFDQTVPLILDGGVGENFADIINLDWKRK